MLAAEAVGVQIARVDSREPVSYGSGLAFVLQRSFSLMERRVGIEEAASGMGNMFNYDWFTGTAFEKQKQQARLRCACRKFPDLSPEQRESNAEFQTFHSELEVRTLIYLRDGFSYELRELVDVGLTNWLTFECEPVDEHYKVGAFVVSLAYEEIVRVEVFAVHPREKPEDMPLITGFRSGPGDVALREESRGADRD